MSITLDVEERFWNKVNKKSNDECWEWKGYIRNGYGMLHIGGRKGRKVRTHRIAWILTYGEMPYSKNRHDYCVCHKCDNTKCCNPNHLFLGSQRDNVYDMIQKKRDVHTFQTRNMKGENHPEAKLSDESVKEIISLAKKEKITHQEIANKFKVSRSLITGIVNNKRWKHISSEELI